MKTWLTADWHLGETRFELMGRPFKTTDEHNATIIERHNSLVQPDDVVIVVGDAVYQKAPEYLPLVAKLNGKKVLIRGNHDTVLLMSNLHPISIKLLMRAMVSMLKLRILTVG